MVIENKIGDGFFGVVYRGVMTRSAHYDSLEGVADSVDVAIKMLKRKLSLDQQLFTLAYSTHGPVF